MASGRRQRPLMALLTHEGQPSLLSLLFLKALVKTREVSFFTFGGLISHHFLFSN